MAAEVIRFPDPEQRSRNADACHPRDPADSAVIIILPVVPLVRHEPEPRSNAR